MNRQLISTSKFLSLVLRHQPETIGMTLDAEGWLPINELIDNAQQRGHSLTLVVLHEVVVSNDKQRFALSEDGLRIRANQGHSLPDVALNLKPVEPPDQLFHGTVAAFVSSIRQHGLLKRSRNHVHLSADEETASRVARRRGTPVILTIASAEMHAAGLHYYFSENGVWLTDAVPVRFVKFPD